MYGCPGGGVGCAALCGLDMDREKGDFVVIPVDLALVEAEMVGVEVVLLVGETGSASTSRGVVPQLEFWGQFIADDGREEMHVMLVHWRSGVLAFSISPASEFFSMLDRLYPKCGQTGFGAPMF